jgi:plasmid stabilization system protein ParE
VSDRDVLFTYFEAVNPSAVVLVDERIATAVRHLIEFPARGRIGRITGPFELLINGMPYNA